MSLCHKKNNQSTHSIVSTLGSGVSSTKDLGVSLARTLQLVDFSLLLSDSNGGNNFTGVIFGAFGSRAAGPGSRVSRKKITQKCYSNYMY